jgi:gas vesicle protein
MYDYRRGESVLGAFLLGGIIGGVLGLLFAPRSGKENREIIAGKAKEYWGEGVEFYETGRDKASEVYHTGKEKATEVYQTGKEKATETAEDLRMKIDSARDRLREQAESVTKGTKDKVAEKVPAAKETLHKVGDAVKSGVDIAEEKTMGALDKLASKSEPDAPDTAPLL